MTTLHPFSTFHKSILLHAAQAHRSIPDAKLRPLYLPPWNAIYKHPATR